MPGAGAPGKHPVNTDHLPAHDAERHQTLRHEDQVRDQLLETTARLTKCLTVYHKIILSLS